MEDGSVDGRASPPAPQSLRHALHRPTMHDDASDGRMDGCTAEQSTDRRYIAAPGWMLLVA